MFTDYTFWELFVAGFLGGITSLMLYILLRAIKEYIIIRLKNDSTLARLYRLDDNSNPQSIYLVSGGIVRSDRSSLVNSVDTKALNLLHRTVEELFPKIIVHQVQSPRAIQVNDKVDFIHINKHHFEKDHSIVVGGPKYNALTNDICNHLPINICFNEDGTLEVNRKIYFKSDYKDYGLLVRLKHPEVQHKTMFVIAGCGAYGTLAASLLLVSKEKNLRKKLLEHMGNTVLTTNVEFAVVVSCNVKDGDVENIEIEYTHPLSKSKNTATTKQIINQMKAIKQLKGVIRLDN